MTRFTGDILLVEDDQNDVELALSVLSKTYVRHQISVVQNGEEALDYLYRRGKFELRDGSNPVVVVLDLKMPKVSGLEVLQTIKRDPLLQAIPVVILSSSRVQEDMAECYKLGANAYVVKPIEFLRYKEALRAIGLFWSKINEPPTPE